MITDEELVEAASGDPATFETLRERWLQEISAPSLRKTVDIVEERQPIRAPDFGEIVVRDGTAILVKDGREEMIGSTTDTATRTYVQVAFRKCVRIRPETMRYFAVVELHHDLCPACGRFPIPMKPGFQVRDVLIERCAHCGAVLIVDMASGEIHDSDGEISKHWTMRWL